MTSVKATTVGPTAEMPTSAMVPGQQGRQWNGAGSCSQMSHISGSPMIAAA